MLDTLDMSATGKDKEQIEGLYREMYKAMIAKDSDTLTRVLDDDFVLIHMTGMRQDRKTYIDAIEKGVLNYYSEEQEQLKVSTDGDKAVLIGKSRVTAAVFGGGRNTWRLELRFELRKRDGCWRFTRAQAGTY